MVLVITLLVFLFLARPVFASVVINEFMAHPSSGNSEWVEFYNPDSLDLTSYFIDDDTSFSSDSGSSTKKSLSTTSSSTYPTIDLSSILNNSGDFVVLFDNSGNIIDQYQYTSDPGTDIAFGRSPDGGNFTTLSSSSKGLTNSGGTSPSPSPSPSPTSSFTISSIPSEINSDQTFTINVNLILQNYPDSKFYLKGAFKKSDSSNYFGLTKVSSSWIQNGSSYANQFQLTTNSSGSFNGNLEIQPDVLDSGYSGTGDYIFKVGRYSDSGSGPTWSNEVNIKIIAKEIESEEGLIDLSGIGVKKDSVILGEDTDSEELPEEVYSLEHYSLEKYRKLASQSAEPTPSVTTQIKSDRGINPLSLIGTILIIGGLLATIITYGVRKFRN